MGMGHKSGLTMVAHLYVWPGDLCVYVHGSIPLSRMTLELLSHVHLPPKWTYPLSGLTMVAPVTNVESESMAWGLVCICTWFHIIVQGHLLHAHAHLTPKWTYHVMLAVYSTYNMYTIHYKRNSPKSDALGIDIEFLSRSKLVI